MHRRRIASSGRIDSERCEKVAAIPQSLVDLPHFGCLLRVPMMCYGKQANKRQCPSAIFDNNRKPSHSSARLLNNPEILPNPAIVQALTLRHVNNPHDRLSSRCSFCFCGDMVRLLHK